MKKSIYILTGIILASQLFSCMPSRIVRPLEKGQRAIGAHLGGPLIGFGGTTIPIPFTSLMYAQGVTEKTTAFASIHTTSLLFGVIQTDIGAVYNLYYNDSSRIGFSVALAVNMAYDTWESNFKIWPQLDVNMYWNIRPKKSFVYLGVDNWFELSGKKEHGQKQTNRWIINPQIGYTNVRKKWNHNIEFKYLVPYLNNEPGVVDYKGISGKGALGVYISFTRKF